MDGADRRRVDAARPRSALVRIACRAARAGRKLRCRASRSRRLIQAMPCAEWNGTLAVRDVNCLSIHQGDFLHSGATRCRRAEPALAADFFVRHPASGQPFAVRAGTQQSVSMQSV